MFLILLFFINLEQLIFFFYKMLLFQFIFDILIIIRLLFTFPIYLYFLIIANL